MTCRTVDVLGKAALVMDDRLPMSQKRRRCQYRGCSAIGHWICDYPRADGTLCNMLVCEDHAYRQPGRGDTHYCEQHRVLRAMTR